MFTDEGQRADVCAPRFFRSPADPTTSCVCLHYSRSWTSTKECRCTRTAWPLQNSTVCSLWFWHWSSSPSAFKSHLGSKTSNMLVVESIVHRFCLYLNSVFAYQPCNSTPTPHPSAPQTRDPIKGKVGGVSITAEKQERQQRSLQAERGRSQSSSVTWWQRKQEVTAGGGLQGEEMGVLIHLWNWNRRHGVRRLNLLCVAAPLTFNLQKLCSCYWTSLSKHFLLRLINFIYWYVNKLFFQAFGALQHRLIGRRKILVSM